MSDIRMKNYMEDCVADMMQSVLTDVNCCSCERCRLDIMAYVLNKLPPKYVVTRKGHLYTKLSAIQTQFDVDIVSSIAQAAALISTRPRHDENYDD
jgi:competence protein ComFB